MLKLDNLKIQEYNVTWMSQVENFYTFEKIKIYIQFLKYNNQKQIIEL